MPAHAQHWDVIVLGLGGMGSAAAFHTALRGKRVLGLDQFHPPHSSGSSHGATRVVRQAYFEHPAYVPMLLRAYELWRDLESRSNQTLLHLPGGLMMGPEDSAVVQGSLQSAREHRLEHEFLSASAIRQRFPQFQIPDHTVALFEKTAGFVACEASVSAHLAAAQIAGADLHFNEPVLNWSISPSSAIQVQTPTARYSAERLIITPGPWAPQLLADLQLPLEVTRQILMWFDPPGGIQPFLPPHFPIFIHQLSPGLEIYGFPAVDGPKGGVKVAFFHKPNPEVVTPETVDRTIRPDDESTLRAAVTQLLPTLNGRRLHATTCLYTTTPDHHFILCPHPRHPQVTVACGFSGHGYKFCPVIGEILADLSLQGASSHNLQLFQPQRFKPPIRS